MDEALRRRLSRLVAERRSYVPAKRTHPYDFVTLHSLESDTQCLRPGERVNVLDEMPQGLVHEQALATLQWVDQRDVVLMEGEGLVYLPNVWRFEGETPETLWSAMSDLHRRTLEYGELASIHRHSSAITAVMHETQRIFEVNMRSTFCHGPDHWRRVSIHGISVSRSLRVDPVVAYVFGLVHDSHRLDDGYDLEHGPRAADFVKQHRGSLFSFLDDVQVGDLCRACRFHSDGLREGSRAVRACWDADRLDLWRIEVRPDPRYLCTSYARCKEVIDRARDVYVVEREKQREERRARITLGCR